ncbi:MAG: twin-arginine translocation signal domain-containing protein [Rhodobacteraceae bacterium]|nr:twin-arginine translocation signal domain-containing protein [Paracoccaceae bacterium]
MRKKSDSDQTSRRDFLKLASVSAPAAVAAATLSAGEAEAALPEDVGEGMQDTPHTRKYFETARF